MRHGNGAERGHAVLEFALGATMLSLIFGGVYQFGYTLYAYNGLETTVTNAARVASRATIHTDQKAAFVSDMKNLVVYGNTAGTGGALVPGLTPANVTVAFDQDPSAVPFQSPGTVTVGITGYRFNALFHTFTFNGKPSVTMKYTGNVMVPELGNGSGGGGGNGKKS